MKYVINKPTSQYKYLVSTCFAHDIQSFLLNCEYALIVKVYLVIHTVVYTVSTVSEINRNRLYFAILLKISVYII